MSAQEILRQHPGIAYVGNDRRIDFSWAPPSGAADPYFAKKAGATNVGQFQWGLQAMNFPGAWSISTGHGYVGAVDSGLPLDNTSLPWHTVIPIDLANNFRLQFSYDPIVWNNAPDDFHGTHVLGIIGATRNNALGVSGACPNCSLAMAEVDSASSTIAAGFRRLVDRGVQVINYSSTAAKYDAASPEYSCTGGGGEYEPICSAIGYAGTHDVLVVAASGNFSRPYPGFPANHPDVLSVAGAQNTNLNVPGSWAMWSTSVAAPGYGSNFGSSAAGNAGVVAPAAAVVSVVPDRASSKSYIPEEPFYCSDYYAADLSATGTTLALGNADGYATCTGTSMAAPHVSALAGILRSIDPRKSKDSIKSAIRSSGNYASAPNTVFGYGMPNAQIAVSSVRAQMNPS